MDLSFRYMSYHCFWLFSRLDSDTGQLRTNGRVVEGEYTFRVKVYDVVWKREVVSTATVTIREIGDEAVFNSGSVRLQGNFRQKLETKSA